MNKAYSLAFIAASVAAPALAFAPPSVSVTKASSINSIPRFDSKLSMSDDVSSPRCRSYS